MRLVQSSPERPLNRNRDNGVSLNNRQIQGGALIQVSAPPLRARRLLRNLPKKPLFLSIGKFLLVICLSQDKEAGPGGNVVLSVEHSFDPRKIFPARNACQGAL